MEMADLYSLYRMVTFKILSRSPKSDQLFLHSNQCIYVRLVKIHPLVQKITHRNHILNISTLKIKSRSPKSNQLFQSSHKCIYANLGHNPFTGSKDNAPKRSTGMPTKSAPKATCPAIPSGNREHKKGPCFLEDGAFRKFRGLSRIIPVLHLGPDFRHFVTNFCNLYSKKNKRKSEENL